MQSLGQLMMVGIAGKTLTDDERKFLIEEDIAGVTLFARNVESPEQIRDLCEDLQSLSQQTASKSPMMIAVDQEGGRVARLRAPPFTLWPPLKKLGDLDSPLASFQFAKAMGYELRAVGINTDWAPCVDVFTNPQNEVIGDRSLSSDARQVSLHGSALVRGYLKAGILPCAKHFPGHGNTLLDSHEDLPTEGLGLDKLWERELLPFQETIRAGVPLIMTGHLLFEKIDPEWPVTLSEKFLKEILREKMNYQGLIVTDDLDMKALSRNYEHKVLPVRSLLAGADMLLYCNQPSSPPKALKSIRQAMAKNELPTALVESVIQRILRFKKIYLESWSSFDRSEMSQYLGTSSHQKLSQGIRQGDLEISEV